MSRQTKYYVIYSEQDKHMALELMQKLEKMEVYTSPIKQIINPGDLIEDFRDAVFIVLLSVKSTYDMYLNFRLTMPLRTTL